MVLFNDPLRAKARQLESELSTTGAYDPEAWAELIGEFEAAGRTAGAEDVPPAIADLCRNGEGAGMNALYCDGGVISKNPSSIGGTFAYRILEGDRIIRQNGGVLVPDRETPLITNNVTEMLALVRALGDLPDGWIGTIYSDSQVTLGRAFLSWKWTNVPAWLRREFAANRGRMHNWEKITWVLLGRPSHPGAAAGRRWHHGYPVSEHNMWCDKECGRMAEAVLRTIAYHDRIPQGQGV